MFMVVLFNLKQGVSVADYEAFAKTTDLPTVRSLKSMAGFDVFKLLTVRGADAAPPYQYIEILEIADETQFGVDVATDTMKAVAGRFRELADNPTFIVSEKLEA